MSENTQRIPRPKNPNNWLASEETPAEKRRGIEAQEAGEMTPENLKKQAKFLEYREQMAAAATEKLKDFISWTEERLTKEPDYKEEYRNLQKKAAELIVNRINNQLSKKNLELSYGEAIILIQTIKNVYELRMEELKEEEKEAIKMKDGEKEEKIKKLMKEYAGVEKEADELVKNLNF